MGERFREYYKNDPKHFKNLKRGLALRKKITKHYAKKSRLACAKLKEALIEVKNLKEEKEHDNLGFLAEASHQFSKTPEGISSPILRKFGAFFVF